MRGQKTKKLWDDPEYRKRMSEAHIKNGIGYSAIHKWVTKWKTKPSVCGKCGKCGKPNCRIEWANIDHKYRRVLDDYIPLCVSCHFYFDKENNNKTPKNQFS